MGAPMALLAQTSYTWTGAGGTAWNNAANWSPNTGFPSAVDNATIVSTANAPVLDANRSVANLTVPSGTLNLNSRVLTATGTVTCSGGAVNNGTLTLNNTVSTATFSGTTFGAAVNGTTASVLFNGSTFNSTVTVTKTGSGSDMCTGGNTFNGVTTLSVTNGRLYVNNTGVDAFNANLVLNCTGSGGGFWFGNSSGSSTLAAGSTITSGVGGFSAGALQLRNFTQAGATAQNIALSGTATLYYLAGVAFNGTLTSTSPGLYLSGGTFNGAATFTKTGLNNEYSGGGNTYNGNTEFIVTGAGTLQLCNTGADQFNGNLVLNSTGTGGLRFGTGSGTATLAAGRTLTIGATGWSAGTLGLKGFTQAGTATTIMNLSGTAALSIDAGTVLNGNIVATAPSLILNAGTFNGNARFTKTAATDDWGNGGATFNGSLELTNTSPNLLGLGYTNSDAYNGNLIVNNTSTGTIRFGNASTTATETLASGRTITVGGTGFNTGALVLHNFIQAGSTPQVLTFGSGATLNFNSGCVLNGNFTSTSGGIYTQNSTFNATAKFSKTGTGSDVYWGGNTFNATLELNLSGTGSVYVGEQGPETFNADVLVTNTAAAQIRFCNSGVYSASLASGAHLAVGPAGFTGGVLLLRNFTQNGSTAQTLSLSNTSQFQIHQGCTFNGSLTVTTGALYLNGGTFNASSKFTKTGTTGDASTGGNVFNAPLELINTNTGALNLHQTGIDAFNDNVLLNNTGTGQINFGFSGGSSTLASGRTIAVGALGFTGGQLQLRNFTQSGSTAQTLSLGSAAGLYFQSGSTFNGNVTSTSGTLYLNGTTFNGTGKFTKTGISGDGSTGGNVFNGAVEFINTNAGNLSLDYSGVDAFNDNIVLNNTSTGQINFGQSGGSATLATGKTITVGALGYPTGLLVLKNFTQVGGTPQNLLLGTGSTLYFQAGNTFNGNITTSSGGLYLNGTTFNGTGKFTKTGPSGDGSTGGNVFNGAVELVNTGAGNFSLDYSGVDAFNDNIVLNNTSTGQIYFGQSGGSATLANGKAISVGALGYPTGVLSFKNFTQLGNTPQNLPLGTGTTLYFLSGNTFNGNITTTSGALYFNGTTFNGAGKFTKTGSSGDGSSGGNVFNAPVELINTNTGNLSLDLSGVDAFNDNIVLNNTSTGQIYFGQSGGSATLANGKAISVGALGYASGSLTFRNFTQVGSTPQSLPLGTGTTLVFLTGNTFNGNITTSSGALYFNGTTFNGTGTFTKSGTSGDPSSGGNVFNGAVELINTNTGNLSLDHTGTDQFNGDILVNSTSTGQINFGLSGGSATLAAGRTISVGATGFPSGSLNFRNFTQVGPTPQSLLLGAGATLGYQTGTTFNGNIVSTSASVYFTGTTFNGTGKFTKTGPLNDNSNGGCIFNGTAEFIISGPGNIGLDCYTGTDQFNSDILVNNTSTGQLGFGQISGYATLAAGRTISVGSAGFGSGTLFLRNFTQLGSTPQNILLTGSASLRFEAGNTFNGNVVSTSSVLFFNGTTFNGTGKFTKTGASGDNSIGGNTFNANAELVMAGTGNLFLNYSGTDQFNGDLLVNSTNTGQIGFGQSTGNAVLAAGHSIGVGSAGYSAGQLLLRNFTQMGGSAQNLAMGVGSTLYYQTGTTFNGPLASSSGNLYLNGSTFNGSASFTKTGGSGNNSSGGNVFNGTTEFINLGAGQLDPDYNGVDAFNGDLLLNSTGGGGIWFGLSTGSATLASGKVMGVGATGLTAGYLYFRNFTQLGTSAHTLIGTGTSGVQFFPGTTFNGPITTSTANLVLSGATFNGVSSFTKTGGTANTGAGGNVFNGDVTVTNTSASTITLASSTPDDFNGNATFIRTGAGTLVVDNSYNSTFSQNVSTVGSTASVTFGLSTGHTIFDGSGVQTFSSDAAYPPQVRNLTVNKSGGTLDLLGNLQVTTDIAFTNGVIRPQAATSSSNGLLILNNGINTSDPADVGSYVDGFVRKIGNVAFTFPVGNAGYLAPITLTPTGGAATDHFTAKYTWTDPNTSYNVNAHDASLNHISRCEYWVMDRTGGTANGKVTLPWDTPRSCGVTNLADLSVAHWNGSLWKDEGHGTTSGTTTAGTIQTFTTMSTFSPFTLASFSVNNPLPVELLSFTAAAEGQEVRTQWATASERNNERFEVERSADGEHFEEVGTLPGAGDSQQELHYELMDEQPLAGLSYYRLKQVDLDGTATYSDVVPVYFGGALAEGLNVFPDPATTTATLSIRNGREGPMALTVWNMQGEQVMDLSRSAQAGDMTITLQLEGLSTGIYVVRVAQGDGLPREVRFMKQ